MERMSLEENRVEHGFHEDLMGTSNSLLKMTMDFLLMAHIAIKGL
jgi:hypothetical protein